MTYIYNTTRAEIKVLSLSLSKAWYFLKRVTRLRPDAYSFTPRKSHTHYNSPPRALETVSSSISDKLRLILNERQTRVSR